MSGSTPRRELGKGLPGGHRRPPGSCKAGATHWARGDGESSGIRDRAGRWCSEVGSAEQNKSLQSDEPEPSPWVEQGMFALEDNISVPGPECLECEAGSLGYLKLCWKGYWDPMFPRQMALGPRGASGDVGIPSPRCTVLLLGRGEVRVICVGVPPCSACWGC